MDEGVAIHLICERANHMMSRRPARELRVGHVFEILESRVCITNGYFDTLVRPFTVFINTVFDEKAADDALGNIRKEHLK